MARLMLYAMVMIVREIQRLESRTLWLQYHHTKRIFSEEVISIISMTETLVFINVKHDRMIPLYTKKINERSISKIGSYLSWKLWHVVK